MRVSDYVFNNKGDIKLFNQEGKGITNYRLYIKCDECGKEYTPIFVNWKQSQKRHRGIDLCTNCCRKGERNSQYGKDRKEICKYARKCVKNNSRNFSKETKEKMSKIKKQQILSNDFNIKSNNRGHRSWYYSTKNNETFYADSYLELLRMIQLDKDDDVISWTKRHGISIPYEYNDIMHNYIPDFLIEYKNGKTVIEELKGYETETDLIKKKAGENFFIDKDDIKYKYITQNEMNKDGEYRSFLKKLKIIID